MAKNSSSAHRDILAALAFVLLGCLAILRIRGGGITSRIVETQTLTYATLPTIYGALLIIMSLLLALGAYKRLKGQHKEPLSQVQRARRLVVLFRTFGALILLIVYAFLLEHVPFVLLTTIFLAVLFVLFGRRSPLKIAGISILGGVGFHFLFIYFLNLPL